MVEDGRKRQRGMSMEREGKGMGRRVIIEEVSRFYRLPMCERNLS